MKLIQFGDSHHKNTESMKRMCNKFNIEYYYSDTLNSEYDIIWSPCKWINPDLYPSSKFIFGPQFWVFPNLNDPLFTQSTIQHKSRCIYTCLADWNLLIHNEFISSSNIPFLPLPLGVDIQDYNKNNDEIEYDCILYFKNRYPSLLNFIESVLK